MRSSWPALLLTLAAIIPWGSATAATFEEECNARLPKSVFAVQTEPSAIKYDFSQSAKELTAKHSYHGKHGTTLGLTETKIKVESQWAWQLLTEAGGSTCLRPSALIFVSVNPQTVYIAKEFSPGSCAFKEIAQHELRHVSANQKQMEQIADKYQRILAQHFGQNVLYGSDTALKRQIEDSFKHYWIPKISEELQKVSFLHQQIDTPQEYARNSTLCGGIVPKILGAKGYPLKAP
jgi:hypothetical protein